MKFYYTITPSPDELARKLKGDLLGARKAGMINTVTTIEAVAHKDAPVKTSNLANSGTSDVNADGSEGTITFTAKYAEWAHEGTGLYGPRKAKIVPKAKKALFWPGCKHPVRSVAGMKGRPFLRKAAEGADIPALYKEGMENFLRRS